MKYVSKREVLIQVFSVLLVWGILLEFGGGSGFFSFFQKRLIEWCRWLG